MAILAVSVILIQKSVRSTAQIVPPPFYDYEISGWSWASSAGWLSLNCYNDFSTPGVYESRCNAEGYSDYGLGVNTVSGTSYVQGCAWAGNGLNNNGNPLGWVCFSDPFSSYGPSFAVATSSTYLNALAPTTFASILNQENWKCVGTTDGLNDGDDCRKSYEAIDCPGGSCFFDDDGAWQLGFPISSQDIKVINPSEPDLPSQSNPLEGCFNCYEEYDYACNNDTNVSCTDDSACIGLGTPATNGTCSVVTAIYKNCDNCLEYFYYPGRCGDGTGTHTGSQTYCNNSEDCDPSEVCEPIYTCDNDIETECTGQVTDCGGVPSYCTLKDIGSLKKLIGAYDCTECNIEDYNNVCGVNSYKGNLNSCNSCVSTFYTPGVMLDNKHYGLDIAAGERANLCGWAWNAWSDGINYCSISGDSPCSNPVTDCTFGAAEACQPNIYGLGWFQFEPRVVTSTKPYISVEGGNIYSKGNISGRYLPPFGHYNASYLIEAGGTITNFISSSTLGGIYQGEFPYRPSIDFFQFDNSNLKYTNALGSIDYVGLFISNPNKYGSKVNTIVTNNVSITQPLGGQVYYYTSSLTMDDSVPVTTIPIGTAAIPNASGIVIVAGDLVIDRNIEYATGNYTNLKNIPSVVWIVRGDLLIGPTVTNLAGTFIVLGDGNTATCDPTAPAAHCGQINTCNTATPATCDDNPLTISGNVLAKYFNLSRTYIDQVSKGPSEKFINDGHIQANPPAGLEDFSNVIPRFTEN